MTLQRTTIDRDVLPVALLDAMKAHMRVDHARDDDLIKTYIAAAIGLVEHKCNVSLDPATYIASADELTVSTVRVREAALVLPLNNVRAVTIDDGATPPTDLSDAFTLWNPDFGGNGASYLVAATVNAPTPRTDWVLELTVGIEDPDTLAPAFFALIARLAGSLYENREASVALWASTWDSELAAFWRPSA
jgi:hypothetical protein